MGGQGGMWMYAAYIIVFNFLVMYYVDDLLLIHAEC